MFLLNFNGYAQLFADDIVLMYKNENVSSLFRNMQLDLNGLSKWIKKNHLMIFPNKTKYILFQNKTFDPGIATTSALMVNNNIIEKVSSYSYLGLVIDSTFKWNQHIQKVKNSILPYVFAIRKTKNILPKSILNMIYNSYIHSRIVYLNPIWILWIFLLRKKVIKFILNLPIRTPSNSLFHCYLSIKNINYRELLLVAFKIIRGLIRHNYQLVQVQDTHNYPTRRQSHYRNEFFRTNVSDNNVLYRCLELFNKLPRELRYENSFSKFKSSVTDLISNGQL